MNPGSSKNLLHVILAGSCVLQACGSKSIRPYVSRELLWDPQTCGSCHPDHYRQWSSSMHAYAADDPVFLAMNRRAQRETHGALGSFCVNCHAPMAVREGATHDGLNLEHIPQAFKGVTCYFCHNAGSVNRSHNNGLELSHDATMRGAYSNPVPTSAHRSVYSTLHDRDRMGSSSLCGSCHDIVTPAGARIERTFEEWQQSIFSHPNAGATCSQCHMEQRAHPKPIAVSSYVPRQLHSHDFAAVDVALTSDFPGKNEQIHAVESLLHDVVQSALCVVDAHGQAGIRVIVDNVAAGHGFPSGASQDRRLWAEVVAYKNNQIIYQSGVVPEGMDVTALKDPDLWLIRDCIFDSQGRQVHMFWQAASFDSNALGTLPTLDPLDPRYRQTHVVQNYPRGAGAFLKEYPDRVSLRLRLRPMGLDILDDLIQSGDLDASVRGQMPTFEVGGPLLEWRPETSGLGYVENGLLVRCVSATHLDVASPKVPAPSHNRCQP